MKDNRISISLSTLIIALVIVVVVVIGVVFFVYNHVKNEYEGPSTDTPAESAPVTNTNTVQENYVASITGKSSSQENPLSIGDWGIASKYIFGEYRDIPVRVTKVTRGDEAAKQVKDYCETGSSVYEYKEPEEGMEWAVIQYTVDLMNVDRTTSIRTDAKITGTDSTSIKYNGKSYVVSTMGMTTNSTKSEVGTGYFAAQLPIGCKDYLIVMGAYSNTQAFYKGV